MTSILVAGTRRAVQACDLAFCSPDWTRTSNPSINSRMLCQLSYGGSLGPWIRLPHGRVGPYRDTGWASWVT
jgi:hypothetical protein